MPTASKPDTPENRNIDLAVEIVVEIVKSAGGTITFEDFDKAYREYPKFKPMLTMCGFGSVDSLEHNNGVFLVRLLAQED